MSFGQPCQSSSTYDSQGSIVPKHLEGLRREESEEASPLHLHRMVWTDFLSTSAVLANSEGALQ